MMSRTLFGFYDLDASPQHGLPGELATRLGTATEAPGFIDGAVFVSSDNFGVAIQAQYVEPAGGTDDWAESGGISVLLQAADWRSRASELGSYRLARHVQGDSDTLKDSTFFIVQRFVVKPSDQAAFIDAICDYTQEYAQPIPGFLAGDAYAGIDGTRVVFVMPWEHEAALNTLENRAGSLASMQRHLRMTERHIFSSYQRISYLRASTDVEAS
jgi:hypothetical protein